MELLFARRKRVRGSRGEGEGVVWCFLVCDRLRGNEILGLLMGRRYSLMLFLGAAGDLGEMITLTSSAAFGYDANVESDWV